MSDFITQLETDLLDAARRLQRAEPIRHARAPRSRRRPSRRLLLAGLVALFVATPALAGVPGVWHGLLSGFNRTPTLTTELPDPRLLSLLGTLRRAPTSLDNTAQARDALTQGGPLDAVSIGGVRYVGVSPIGDPLYLVPYRSRVRQAAEVQLASGHLRAFLDQPGVCLIAIGVGTPEIDDCGSVTQIEQGTSYATVGVYRTHPVANPTPIGPDSRGVIADEASAIVPDGVASVELIFPSGIHVTLAVQDNYFALLTGPGEGEAVPTMIWRDSNGHVVRQITPS